MRRAEELLTDLLNSVELVTDQCRGLDKPRFVAQFGQGLTPFAASVGAGMVVIGEACASLLKTDPDLASRQPGVGWQSLVSLRPIVAHQYFRLHADLCWDAVQDGLHALEHAVGFERTRRQSHP